MHYVYSVYELFPRAKKKQYVYDNKTFRINKMCICTNRYTQTMQDNGQCTDEYCSYLITYPGTVEEGVLLMNILTSSQENKDDAVCLLCS